MPLLEAGDRTSSSEEVAQNEMFARSFRYYLLSFKTGGNMRKVKRQTWNHDPWIMTKTAISKSLNLRIPKSEISVVAASKGRKSILWQLFCGNRCCHSFIATKKLAMGSFCLLLPQNEENLFQKAGSHFLFLILFFGQGIIVK